MIGTIRSLVCGSIVLLVSFVASAAPLQPGATIAFFGLTFIDTSTEGAYFGAREDEAKRLAMLEAYVVDAFTERGFGLLDLEPVEAKMNLYANLAKCNGCEVKLAGELGATYAVVGEVQKVSNLILSMNLIVRDVESGVAVKGLAVDIRGNTDKSWQRGMRYILKNNIFKEQ